MSARMDNRESLRIVVLSVLMLMGLAFLLAALWRLQVMLGVQYAENARRQSMRVVRLPADRGRIFDRNGVCLADNRPSFSLCVFVEEFRKPGNWNATAQAVSLQLRQVSDVIGRPVELSAVDFTNHIHRRLPLPLVAWTNLDHRAMARFAENDWRFKGVEIMADPARAYPGKSLAAHTLGYVNRAELDPEERKQYDYLLPEQGGGAGLEMRYDRALRGRAGRRELRVDASGFMSRTVGETPPEPGSDLVLALDSRIQGLVEEALKGERGSAVVLDPRNGDVLGIASSPAYDLNLFVPAISRENWRVLHEDEEEGPLLNRAIGSFYPPGSLFKPVVGIAGLEHRLWDPDTVVNCPGYYEAGNIRIRCWNPQGHGPVALRKAIEGSCNTYFCTLGRAIGYDVIQPLGRALGLGSKTGIELDGEQAGLMPDSAWKKRVKGDAWRDGDTANASIGQGFLGVTPLQMAVVCAAIANGGRVYRPRLVLGVRPQGETLRFTPAPAPVRDLNWAPRTTAVIRGGMRDVVNAPNGTGKKARLEHTVVAAKTGTAEVGRKGGGRKHVWMMAFAPFDNPRYAVAMVVEEGVSGGSTVGPRVGQLLDAILTEAEAQG